jgi:hypothetical protein
MDQPFPYDLAAVDLDDTLLGPDKRISSVNRAAVHALRVFGVEVVLDEPSRPRRRIFSNAISHAGANGTP